MSLDKKLREIWKSEIEDSLEYGEGVNAKYYGIDRDDVLAQIKQAFAGEYKFDQYLQRNLPHDGKWRHVEFNVKVSKDAAIEFVDRNLMTGQEWYDRYEKELKRQGSGTLEPRMLGSDEIETNVLEAARRAAGLEDTTE